MMEPMKETDDSRMQAGLAEEKTELTPDDAITATRMGINKPDDDTMTIDEAEEERNESISKTIGLPPISAIKTNGDGSNGGGDGSGSGSSGAISNLTSQTSPPPVQSTTTPQAPKATPSISQLAGGPRPNIIQLPGSMLASKTATMGLPAGPSSSGGGQHQLSMAMHPSAATARLMSPTPPGYATSGATHSQMMMGHHTIYHPTSTTAPTAAIMPTGASTGATTTPQQSSQQPTQQKMELQDAFAYLDRVKAEFGDQPEVYNRFLQIMREFKANTIDANGVIVRVVQLFKGHKTLIQGFNAFLPRTHQIDPVVAETGILPPHLMQVAASMGIPINQQGIPMAGVAAVTGHPSFPPQQPQQLSSYPPHWVSSSNPEFVGGMGVGTPQFSPTPYYPQGATPTNFAAANYQVAPGGGLGVGNGGNGTGPVVTPNIIPHAHPHPHPHAHPHLHSHIHPHTLPHPQAHLTATTSTPNTTPTTIPSRPLLHPSTLSTSGSTGTNPTLPHTLPSSPLPPGTSGVPTASVAASSTAATASANKKSSAQFVRAISYVKKIKHRFSTEPEIYKTFLASLHSYHREQKTIFEVYMDVANLFAEHPDLLEEFVLFLPENEAAAITARLAQSNVVPHVPLPLHHAGGMIGEEGFGGRRMTAAAAAAITSKRRTALPTPPTTMTAATTPMSTTPATANIAASLPTSLTIPPLSKAAKRARQAVAMSTRTAEESAFYERVKRYLGDKHAYAEFLKCLNLFCQDIIKMQDLVQLVHRFIGQSEELFGWFKRYIGYKDSGMGLTGTTGSIATAGLPSLAPSTITSTTTTGTGLAGGGGMLGMGGVEGPAWRVGGGGTMGGDSTMTTEMGELNLATCKRVGSYRVYPRSHILSKSSGRTPLCHEVLNDIMVSCPSFNSEDSTFIASRKNQYEEALFRCEDERFEMDLLIEYNLATIAVLEPLSHKIEAMSAEERASLTLGPSLGGTSEIIYRKAIRKIYGEKTDEIMTGLQHNPAIAVPIVLRRLKQKDEEWRRIQRDWNKIWRDTHLKNYYKALDHQGIEFKANDRRNISGRTLIGEIEAIHQEHQRAAERGDPFPASHLEFTIKSISSILSDLALLLKTHIRSSPILSSNDRKALLRFFGSFLPTFFGIAVPTLATFEQTQSPSREASGTSANAGNIASRANLATTPPINTTPQIQEQSAAESDTEESTNFEMNGTEFTASPIMSSSSAGGERRTGTSTGNGGASRKANTPIMATIPPSTATAIAQSASLAQSVLLFANNNLYVFIRLLQLALDRLQCMQTASLAANGQPFFTEKRNVVATFLDLQAQSTNASKEGLSGSTDFYQTLITLLRQLIRNSIDGGLFEERVRFMFGTAAYPIFTFDKLVQALVKQAQLVLTDATCEQLVRLFDSWNRRRSGMRLSEYSARLAVENTVPNKEGIYRIEYVSRTGIMTIQLLERLSEAVSGARSSAEAQWSAYVDEFVKLESNPRYLTPKSRVFLPRTRRLQPRIDPAVLIVQYNLECKIAVNTYKLFYVENTEDFMFRTVGSPRRHRRSRHTMEHTMQISPLQRWMNSKLTGDDDKLTEACRRSLLS